MKHHVLSFALPALLLFGPAAFAGEQPSQVVELFTSQGCSSCPPSNALITDWSKRDDILALTYSVEYWDYLGWKDTFADPEFTARQRAYARAIGHGRVYTPQIIVNGALDKFRFSRAEIDDIVLSQNVAPITIVGEDAVIGGNDYYLAPGTVRLISYQPGTQTVSVKAGENRGRKLELTNVVTGVTVLGPWLQTETRFTLPDVKAGEAQAIILQQDNYGPVISAAVRP